MQANPWGSSTRVRGAGKPMVPRDGSTRWGMCVCAHARMRRCLLKQRGQLRAAAEGMPACLAGNYYVTTTIAYTNTCTCVCVCTLHPTRPNHLAWLYAPPVHPAPYTPKLFSLFTCIWCVHRVVWFRSALTKLFFLLRRLCGVWLFEVACAWGWTSLIS